MLDKVLVLATSWSNLPIGILWVLTPIKSLAGAESDTKSVTSTNNNYDLFI